MRRDVAQVNDDVLTHAFQAYPSFQKARVVRDPRSKKTKGYGFVSFRVSDARSDAREAERMERWARGGAKRRA